MEISKLSMYELCVPASLFSTHARQPGNSIISNYLEHPPGPASRVEPKRSIVVIYHNMSIITDAHLEGKESALQMTDSTFQI